MRLVTGWLLQVSGLVVCVMSSRLGCCPVKSCLFKKKNSDGNGGDGVVVVIVKTLKS